MTNTKQQFQKHHFGDTHSSLHDAFYSDRNVAFIQNQVKVGGKFNSVPSYHTVTETMDTVWEHNAIPWNSIALVNPENPRALLQRMSESASQSLIVNMRQMQAAHAAYVYDVNTHNTGRIGQLDRPESGKLTRGTVPIPLPLR